MATSSATKMLPISKDVFRILHWRAGTLHGKDNLASHATRHEVACYGQFTITSFLDVSRLDAVTCTQTSASDPPERRLTTVGRVAPHIEIKIVDAEGNIVPEIAAGGAAASALAISGK